MHLEFPNIVRPPVFPRHTSVVHVLHKGPALIHHHHSESACYIGAPFGGVLSMGFNKRVMYPPSECHSEQFHYPQILLFLPVSSPAPATFYYLIVLLLPEHPTVGSLFHVGFFHSVTPSYVSSRSFHGLVAHFCSALNNIPLSECISVYWSTHITQGNILPIMKKVALNICAEVFMWTKVFNSFG